MYKRHDKSNYAERKKKLYMIRKEFVIGVEEKKDIGIYLQYE